MAKFLQMRGEEGMGGKGEERLVLVWGLPHGTAASY